MYKVDDFHLRHGQPSTQIDSVVTDSAQASELPAFILGILTSVGGVAGYARTGSVPSIAAGLTVGALVSLPVSPGTSPRLISCSTAWAATASSRDNHTESSLPYLLRLRWRAAACRVRSRPGSHYQLASACWLLQDCLCTGEHLWLRLEEDCRCIQMNMDCGTESGYLKITQLLSFAFLNPGTSKRNRLLSHSLSMQPQGES